MNGNASQGTVACLGAITVDQAFKLEGLAVAGTSNPSKRTQGTGGVAHNVARNLVQLGCAARLVTVVGSDSEGRTLLDAARGAGIDVSLSTSVPMAKSGAYTALLEPDGSLHIGVSDLGICNAMDKSFIESRWRAISSAKIVFADCNLPPATLEMLASRCRQENHVLFVDAVSIAKAGRLPHDLRGIDTLFANRDEAVSLLDSAKSAPGQELAGGLLARGAKRVVVTDGADGLHYANAERSESLNAERGTVRDVSGAGDALIAACIVGRLQERRLGESLKMGLKAAALTTGVPGSVNPSLQLAAIAVNGNGNGEGNAA